MPRVGLLPGQEPEHQPVATPVPAARTRGRRSENGSLEASWDEVTVIILDEAGTDDWSNGLPGTLTEQQAEAFVCARWQVNIVSNRRFPAGT